MGQVLGEGTGGEVTREPGLQSAENFQPETHRELLIYSH